MTVSLAVADNEPKFESNLSAKEIELLLVPKMPRKQNNTSTSNGGGETRSIPDENIIKVLPNKSFTPTLHVQSLVQEKSVSDSPSQRSLNNFIEILNRKENQGTNYINLNGTERSTLKFPILEVSNIGSDESLKKDPLQIQLNSNHNESIIAFTFDGEHIVPVGESSKDDSGNSIISIDEIPQSGLKEKNVFRALKFCFFKLVLRQDEVYQLRWVDYSGEKSKRRSAGLYANVEEAQNILICIHGIIGDTNVMAERVRKTFDENVFDLVLTFDYENLNTPIEETARFFKEALNDVGITAKSRKNITILAHSMGGLVSRHMIEHLDGKNFISKLVMAGTPNAGSNAAKIADYRKLVNTLFTLAANTGFGIPAAASVLGALQYSEKLTVTLEQMHPKNSEFIKALNHTSDPGIPYYIMAGNFDQYVACLLYTSPSPRDATLSRMPSSA